jgi:CO/xanthine dehydrogenase FAD-binding subunit
VEEALELLSEHGEEAKVLAGGQSLGPLLNMRLASPELLVDINGIAELSYIRRRDGFLEVGALARQRAIERSLVIPDGWPLLYEAAPYIGHRTIRNRGTICGSLAHADPAAELLAVATALGARLRIRGPEGERTAGASDFFLSYMTTDLAPDELLVEARFPPLPARTGTAWEEVARRHGDFALVGVAAVVTLAEDGRCEQARLVYTGVAPTPFDAQEAAEMLGGEQPTGELFEEAAEKAAAASDPSSDVHASAAYRRRLVRVLTRRALERALERARGEGDGA